MICSTCPYSPFTTFCHPSFNPSTGMFSPITLQHSVKESRSSAVFVKRHVKARSILA